MLMPRLFYLLLRGRRLLIMPLFFYLIVYLGHYRDTD